MPAMLVHYSFVLEAVPEDEVKYLDAVRLGGQGPDPFFYYGVKPWGKPKDYKPFPAMAAPCTIPISPIPIIAMIDYAMKSPDRDFLLAYIDGLFMHYVVDRTFHQYIFANRVSTRMASLPATTNGATGLMKPCSMWWSRSKKAPT
jgi:hypothetical protein